MAKNRSANRRGAPGHNETEERARDRGFGRRWFGRLNRYISGGIGPLDATRQRTANRETGTRKAGEVTITNI